jgi:formylglycine-generating enzyme required for sulfatase activity
MVLEYLAGETLHEKLKALRVVNQRLPRSETIRIIATVCDAASYAHQRGVVHRDLKPANVMLDPQGQVTLMDFGVAKMLGEPQHTTSGVVVGTVAYMSPEQVRGDALDGRADIYSLGVMLYELVAGRAPFEADSAISLMLKHLNEAVPDIRTFAVDIPEALVRVIDKALQKNAADRFQTAAEMAAALRAIEVKAVSDRVAQEAAIVEEASSLITQRVERAEDERLATEKAEAERLAREKEEQDRLAREAERIEAERLAAQKAEEERRAAETAEAERLAAQRAEKERLAAEKAEAERIAREAAERLVAERLAAQKAEEERLVAEKAEAERLVREKAEQERLAREAAERLEAERLAAGKAEAERVAREKEKQDRLAREAERLAAKKAEEKRLAAEKAEAQRLAREKSEQERLAREEAERLKAERLAAKKAEEKRLAAEKAEAQRLAREKSEQERLAREKAERLEAERLAAETAEAKRLARQRAEQERLARAQVEAERRAGQEHAQPAPLDKAQAAALPAARPTAKGRWPLLLLGAVVVVAIVGLIVALPKAGRQPLPSAAGMVTIAGGQYTIGEVADDNHAPQQQVGVGTFWLDKFAVTNAQYAEFLAKTKRQPPTSWDTGTFPAGKEDYPVEGITFDVASAYCSAVDKRLPTEAEWEVAARGPDHWLYPWGNDRDVVKLPPNPYPVGSIDANHSPFGIYDMAGSVWQWVANPYVQVSAGQRVMRGGSYDNFRDMAYRLSGDPNVPTMYATTGIRCAADQVAGE